MNWANVRLIFAREYRDQLRDRRTLFMIFVLPILLYPLLGMLFLQMAQFRREQLTRVLVIGARDLRDLPPLFENNRFADDLFGERGKSDLLLVEFAGTEPSHGASGDPRPAARSDVQSGRYDVALYFPPDFSDRVAAHAGQAELPRPEVIYTTANDKSQIAYARVSDVLHRWTEQIVARKLAERGVPPSAAKPFELSSADVAVERGHVGAAAWSKILPVLLLVWALTGAFYPAIDLCAGEKERGTLETLLSSPAQRSEIVVGKLATIMLFSAVTAVLNLLSIGLTGWLLVAKLAKVSPAFGPPPAMAAVWLALALVPISALFSALSLALAAFARSTKEGQYYLMPLLLVTMPLAVLSIAPGVELNLGNSLIPVTGIVLLLRSVLEGNYWQAAHFAAPVGAVTLAACLLAVRWAVEQFNSESVLFRESERLDMGLWVRHLMRDREATPTVAGAVFCGIMILVLRFVLSFALPAPANFHGFVVSALVTQLVVIVTPTLLMAVMLTSSPRQTLLLRWPRWSTIPMAALLAVALHPVVVFLQGLVTQLYPLSPELEQMTKRFFGDAPNLWLLLLVVALVPGICEELAFRGFVLSGFRHLGHKWRAIAYSALFFGLTHAILQQSIMATLVGVVIGLIAVQSGSLLPGIVFHIIHNALTISTLKLGDLLERWPIFRKVISLEDGKCGYDTTLIVVAGLVAFVLLAWFYRLPSPKSAEEQLEEAIRRGQKAEGHPA